MTSSTSRPRDDRFGGDWMYSPCPVTSSTSRPRDNGFGGDWLGADLGRAQLSADSRYVGYLEVWHVEVLCVFQSQPV